jgi:undecaprenyl diphosphate synthase
VPKSDQPTSRYASDADAIAAVARMHQYNPDADPLGRLPDVHPARIPRHIAIIMDGNGRWASERGFPRQFGHMNGARVVREVLEEAVMIGVEALTLYSFSMENWKRPREEVDALMELCLKYLGGERDELVRKGIRFRMIGRREGLPAPVLAAIDDVTNATAACRRATLCLAINYGARAEITDAVRAIASRVAAGELAPDSIDESTIERWLSTHGLPDPDLLIRTAGEMRVSNYLLWQISYAEIHVTPTYWPEFGPTELRDAIRDYAGRQRRFGAIEEARAHA